MGRLLRKRRSLNLNEYRHHRGSLEIKVDELANQEKHQFDAVKGDVKAVFQQRFGFTPYKYQVDLADLYEKNQFIWARWCRQSGKSFFVSAILLNDAWEHRDLYIAIVGPSWRQTKLNIRRMGGFARKLMGSDRGIQKTRISLPNGSVIEAFPNNPDTIRGPTFHRIWWEECNFTPNSEDLYDAILFTLGTTNGKLIATSTPWNTDSLFWRMCNHRDFSDFRGSHVTWQEAMEPDGPLKRAIIEKIKRQFGEDPARWRREMEAEWAEDEDVWLSQSLIASCIGTVKNCGEDLQPWDPEKGYEGEFFAGLDPAQLHHDYCVFSVIERVVDKLFLRHLKIFPQGTKMAHVLGYIKTLQDRWGGFSKLRVDFTKEGPFLVADMEEAGIRNAEGVHFTTPRKSEMANLLKQRMSNQRFFYPLVTWEKPVRGDICTELNVERYELRKDGSIGFSHPNGTHDDVWWSIALALYATEMMVEPSVAIVMG
jgi:hypothetical protein